MVPIFFFAKRLCLVLILLGAGLSPWYQIAMLNSMAVASIIYVMWFMPFENKSMNYIEVMNEVTLLLLTYTLWCFTDFVPEAETRHLLGFVFIATSQGNVIVHLTLMVCETMKRVELGCKRCINRRKASASQKTTGQQLRRGKRSSDLQYEQSGLEEVKEEHEEVEDYSEREERKVMVKEKGVNRRVG